METVQFYSANENKEDIRSVDGQNISDSMASSSSSSSVDDKVDKICEQKSKGSQ